MKKTTCIQDTSSNTTTLSKKDETLTYHWRRWKTINQTRWLRSWDRVLTWCLIIWLDLDVKTTVHFVRYRLCLWKNVQWRHLNVLIVQNSYIIHSYEKYHISDVYVIIETIQTRVCPSCGDCISHHFHFISACSTNVHLHQQMLESCTSYRGWLFTQSWCAYVLFDELNVLNMPIPAIKRMNVLHKPHCFYLLRYIKVKCQLQLAMFNDQCPWHFMLRIRQKVRDSFGVVLKMTANSQLRCLKRLRWWKGNKQVLSLYPFIHFITCVLPLLNLLLLIFICRSFNIKLILSIASLSGQDSIIYRLTSYNWTAVKRR